MHAAALGEPRNDPAAARAALAPLSWMARWSLTAGGLGFARFAPGTWGSLPPCFLVAALVAVLPTHAAWTIDASLALLLVWGSVACVRAGGAAEELLRTKDPSCVVADEVAGMSLSLLGLRWHLRAAEGAAADGWWWRSAALIAGAFLLLRAFDVLKPPPCRQIQAARGGWGILLDDLIAGVYANVLLHLLLPASW